jgi:CelD/BcsL family acetyltransferase involved in cellulose biosynthesis
VHIAQSLAETLQARERTRSNLLVDPAVLFDARGETNHLAQPIDDNELTVGITRHDHVEAVRPEIDSRQNVGDAAR